MEILCQVKQAVLGAHGVDAQVAGISFLESLEFYCWAKDAAISLTDKIVSCNASFNEEKICSSAMRLMFQILSWNFRQSTVPPDLSNFKPNAFSAGIRHEATLLKKFERTLVQCRREYKPPLPKRVLHFACLYA
ncbi:hypothetical protein MA16_Dca006071 [Dendrobium catenatum]|uniref:Uncharacterized protein n=1 Tax=Dendrobium catenatum TaxID=906689 RepID=A0A2I0X4E5_9ASPA|nr:hypothetical protein MA16_Dca006071 [Dendrobium catenatum]